MVGAFVGTSAPRATSVRPLGWLVWRVPSLDRTLEIAPPSPSLVAVVFLSLSYLLVAVEITAAAGGEAKLGRFSG